MAVHLMDKTGALMSNYTDEEIEQIESFMEPRGRRAGGQIYPWAEIESEGALLFESDWSWKAQNIDEAEALLDAAWRSREKRMDEDWTYHIGRIPELEALYAYRHPADVPCEIRSGGLCRRRSEALIDKLAHAITKARA